MNLAAWSLALTSGLKGTMMNVRNSAVQVLNLVVGHSEVLRQAFEDGHSSKESLGAVIAKVVSDIAGTLDVGKALVLACDDAGKSFAGNDIWNAVSGLILSSRV